jgi:integrase
MSKDLSIYLKSVKPHRKEALPSCYDPEDVIRVENAIDRRSNIGKRDYAMVLLASRLGLRSSDIRMLEFKDIDWDNSEIKIVQYKTKRHLTLPLLADVGDAIIDYVKNSRPTSRLKNIFLTCTHPYKPCGSATVSSIVKRYFVESGVDCKGRHTGAHALRHSLATAMLGNGTTLPVISGVLGHETSESTMYYLGVDVSSLLKCSLDVPPVDESFYMQKGGILYE